MRNSLDVLEFPALLELVGGYAATTAGRERILGLQPLGSPGAARLNHGLYSALLQLAAAGTPLPQPGFEAVDEPLRRAAPTDSVLDAEALLACRRLLDAAAGTAAFLAAERCAGLPALAAAAARLPACPDLRRALHAALDEHANINDDASPALRGLRRDLAALEQQIQNALRRLLRREDLADVLQEQFSTIRNGRHVVPVRRERRQALRGIVHDHSDSGHTLFVEPDSILPLGNQLADLRLEEKDECRRVLAGLTDRVRADLENLRSSQEALTELDAAAAVARWARDYRCVLPEFGGRLCLREARHPLLEAHLRRAGRAASLIPLQLDLEPELRTLVITGSNSGGKTLVLKTVGLLALAAQAGLPVPVAPGSGFRFFSLVLADIGDQQSIAGNLSTFTGHMQRINEILVAAATAPPLVLLDELGSGTDPIEGGALACAVLAELAGGRGTTIVTTHLGAVKSFAHDQPGMANAAMRFNSTTMEPEYRLEFGQPGASHALAIARRQGIPESVIQRAEGMLDRDHLRLEGMLARLEDEQRLAAQRAREAETGLDEMQRNRRELQTELEKLRDERRRLLHEAYLQAEQLVENTRRELERLLHDAARAGVAEAERREAAKALRADVNARRERLAAGAAQTAPRPRRPLAPGKVRQGMTVWVEKLRAVGEVLSVAADRRQAEVRCGEVRFAVDISELGVPDPAAAKQQPKTAPAATAGVTLPRAEGAVPMELNLIGCRVEQAIPVLEKFLDRAALGGLPQVRVVHGFGTGRLQAGVHEFLRKCPLVKSYRLGQADKDPGGAGATIVRLADR